MHNKQNSHLGPQLRAGTQHLPWVWKGWCVQAVCRRVHHLPLNWNGAWHWGRLGEKCHWNGERKKTLSFKKWPCQKNSLRDLFKWTSFSWLRETEMMLINFMGWALQSEQHYCFPLWPVHQPQHITAKQSAENSKCYANFEVILSHF